MRVDLFEPDFEPAVFSPCRTWRYRLVRRWSSAPPVAFILLNPSTADERNDDPTIRRCIEFAKRWGHGGLVLGNIFAIRSTNPKLLYQRPADAIGPDNDAALVTIARECERVVCGWGAHGALMGRGAAVTELIRREGAEPLALCMTRGGYPGHPLYLSSALDPFAIATPV